MSENIVKSDDINPPKKAVTPKKKVVVAKTSVVKKEIDDLTVQEPVKIVNIDKSMSLVCFEKGASYSTNEGVRFDSDSRIQLLPYETVNILLRLENFRLLTDEEIEEYNKKNDVKEF